MPLHGLVYQRLPHFTSPASDESNISQVYLQKPSNSPTSSNQLSIPLHFSNWLAQYSLEFFRGHPARITQVDFVMLSILNQAVIGEIFPVQLH